MHMKEVGKGEANEVFWLPVLMFKSEKTQKVTKRNARSQSPALQGTDHLSALCLYKTKHRVGCLC